MKKKILSVLLALTMVVTGIYVTQPMANEAWAADAQQISDEITPDAADEGMLDIKMQTSEVYDFNGKDAVDLRVVSSVNGLGYSYVGFNLWYGTDITINKDTGAVSLSAKPTATYKTKSVAERINAEEYKYSPKVVDTSSEYFVTATIEGILVDNFNKNFYIEAYCVPLAGADSTDPIHGTGKLFNIGQAKETINIAVPQGTLSGTTIENVTVGGAKATATLAGYYNGYAHLYVTVDGGKTSLPSASKIVVGGDGSASYAIYRNLETDYTGNNADTSWYTVYEAEGENKFVIATDADLYGFSSLSQSNNFSGATIYAVADIDANDDKGTAEADKFTRSDEVEPYEWTPIGRTDNNATYAFAGTFDGQMHKISGLYFYSDTAVISNYGFFGAASDCTVKKLILDNSYMYLNAGDTYNGRLGCLVGYCLSGTFDSIKVSDTVYAEKIGAKSTSSGLGGIVGVMINTSTTEKKITNCWFDGQLTGAAGGCGGIVGYVKDASTTKIQDCLYTGKIVVAGSYAAGGICGNLYASKLSIEDTLSLGELDTSAYTPSHRGAVIGLAMGYYTNADNTKEIYCATFNNTYGIAGAPWNNYVTTGSNKFNVDGTELSGSLSTALTSEKTTKPRFIYQTTCIGKEGFLKLNLDFTIGDDYAGHWSTTATGTPVLTSFVNEEDMLELDELTTARTVWYDETVADATEYTLYSMADMLGFVSLTDDTFEGKTVKLGADITLNKGEANATGFTPEVEGTALNSWTPRNMAGTFDGNDHAIRGLYINTATGNTGLFASVTGTVQNLRLLNSYIKCTDTTAQHWDDLDFLYGVGSIAGSLSGTLDTVYSDAIIDYTNAYAGGLVGTAYDATTDNTGNTVFTNCSYAGQIKARNGVGGIVGLVVNTKAEMKHCLNMGHITATDIVAGGLCGYLWKDTLTTTLTLEDSLNVGRATFLNGNTWSGGAIGRLRGDCTANVATTYYILDYADGAQDWARLAYPTGTAVLNLTDKTSSDINQNTYNPMTEQAVLRHDVKLSFQTEGAENTNNYWVARDGKVPMLASFEDLLTNVTY